MPPGRPRSSRRGRPPKQAPIDGAPPLPSSSSSSSSSLTTPSTSTRRRRGATKSPPLPSSSGPPGSSSSATTPSSAPTPRYSGLQRERKARTTYTPVIAPTRAYRRRQPRDDPTVPAVPEVHARRLETRIRGLVTQLKYHGAFVAAYEAEGWRRASRDKLKPQRELAAARAKILGAQSRVRRALDELEGVLRAREPPSAYLMQLDATPDAAVEPDRIRCARCDSTETAPDNEILLCDFEGCFRAYHQRCQAPHVRTEAIPQGEEPWFCGVCLAVFNALKCINYAFDTRYERLDEVFPEVTAATANGGADAPMGDDEEDEEADDEDYAESEEARDDEDEDEDEDKDEDRATPSTVPDDDLAEVETSSTVSEDELQYLHREHIISSSRRTTRSQAPAGGAGAIDAGLLGARVARMTNGSIEFGVIVEEQQDDDNQSTSYRVVFSGSTIDQVTSADVQSALDLAREHAHEDPTGGPASDGEEEEEEVDRALIVQGKRKRRRVDYRELNDLLFAGTADSDEEAAPDARDDEDGDYVEPPTNGQEQGDRYGGANGDAPASADTLVGRRGRRNRGPVDYRALHEGVLSC